MRGAALKPRTLGALLVIALSGRAAVAATDYVDAHYRVLSASDCVDASQMIAEFSVAPLNTTYMRVQHIGDVGTPELAGEIQNPVTWNVGPLTGLALPTSVYLQAQRGYRDIGPPNAASAFQLWCNSAGFYLNSRQFRHTLPLTREGPSVSVARDFQPGLAPFSNATSALTFDATIALPVVKFAALPIIDGTVQLSFVYYARDQTTGTVFAHVIALFDNRPSGVNGAGTEAVSADAYTAFVVSPLRTTTHDGTPTAYVTVSPLSNTEHFIAPWSGPSYFRAHVTYGQFKAMLLRLKRDSLPNISARPEDYRITLAGLLGEMFPGLSTDHEVELGASMTDFKVSEAYYDVAIVQAIEFYNAALDHYFMSSRQDDIDALDFGRLPGWSRTGQAFAVFPQFVSGTSPVCRYYFPPQVGDSHFFSASVQECAEVASKFPSFVLEDPDVMFVALPNLATGMCASTTTAVFRLWNQRLDSNHRYTTDRNIRKQMLAKGYVAEGYGPDGVVMCLPGATSQV